MAQGVYILDHLSIDQIAAGIQAADGNVSEAARRLDIGRSSLIDLIASNEYLKKVVNESRHELLDLSETVCRERLRDRSIPNLQMEAVKTVFKHLGHLRGYNGQDTNVYTSGGQVVINRVVEASDKPPEAHGKS